MRRRAACCSLMVLALAVHGQLARADVVTLTNGDHISGTLELVDVAMVVIKTDYAGRINVKRSAVAGIDTDDVCLVRLTDGGQLAGQIAAAPPAALVVGERQVALDAVRTVVKEAAAVVRLRGGWNTRADAAASVSSGNTDASTFSVGIASELQQQVLRHRGGFRLNREEGDGNTSKDQLRVSYGLDWFFRENWYANFDSEYFRDQLRDLDSRTTLGGGLGRQFWGNSQGALSAELGASAVLEDINGVRETNPALRWAVDFNRFLWGKRVELFHEHSILVLADTDRGQVIDTSTGLRTALAQRWSATAQLDFDYETKPASGRDKEDITWALGLSYRFGQ